MPEIKPFRGILYNPQKVNMNDAVAPPYDVISPELQNTLYNRSPYNIVRLILGREENRYISASNYFEEWKRERILETDQANSLYLLSQQFTLPDGKRYDRRGFIAACKLEEYGKGSIFPHEKTYSKPKEDRLHLFQSTHAMFSQIFGLYSDPKHILDQYLKKNSAPDIETEFEGVQQKVWRINDSLAVAAIAEFIRHQKILVADGHHRYETALLYRDSQRLKNPSHTGKEPYNFVPMFFANMHDPGLVILPTHRLLHDVGDFNQSDFLDALNKYFHLDVQASEEELLHNLAAKKRGAFGLIFPNLPQYVLVWLRKKTSLKEHNISDINASLDVGILHSFLFWEILHLPEEEQAKGKHIAYEKDAQHAIDAVKNGKAQMAFILNPTLIEQVKAVAEAGFTMPQKSTYFYPKLLSGLVTYSFAQE